MKWNKLFFYKKYVMHDSGKSFLIALPKDSELSGYYFWISSRLVGAVWERDDLAGMIYTDDFEFNLFKENHFCEKIESKKVMAIEVKKALAISSSRQYHIDFLGGNFKITPEHLEPIQNPQPCGELIDE